MEIKFFTINNISNLHVGSGNANYGVIDNLVQKDINTGLPTIHSSGVKGALRKYFKHQNNSFVDYVFGKDGDKEGDKGDNKGTKSGGAGKWKFLSADLLSRPVRSNKIQYFNATSVETINHLLKKAEKLGIENDYINALTEFAKHQNPAPKAPVVFEEKYTDAKIEENDWKAIFKEPKFKLETVKKVLGENIVLINNKDFREIALPVIARNHLESGKSQNLWYEEVVPYDSYFGLFIITDNQHYDEFYENGIKDKIVQIGANASIGYGLCNFKEIL